MLELSVLCIMPDRTRPGTTLSTSTEFTVPVPPLQISLMAIGYANDLLYCGYLMLRRLPKRNTRQSRESHVMLHSPIALQPNPPLSCKCLAQAALDDVVVGRRKIWREFQEP